MLFNQAQMKQIETKVAEVEKKTSGEIVVKVVPASGQYRWVRGLWAGIGLGTASASLGILSVGAHWAFSVWQVFEWQLAGALAFSFLPFWMPARRLFIPKKLAAERVDRAAMAAFTALGVGDTRDRTGILIYLSELEHRVEILADRGIHAKAGKTYWDLEVRKIVDGIHARRATDALCEAIDDMGKKLAENFPPRTDDKNELPDSVR